MLFERVLTEFRELLAQLAHEVEMSVSSGHTNIAHISEALFLGLLNALYGWKLKDMNADKRDYPAIDLADDDARVAIQVTATTNITKIKATISKFIEHELQDRYSRLIVLVITKRQETYQQSAIDAVTRSRMTFDAAKDIIDYRTLATHASTAKPYRVQLALSHLKTYLRGIEADLADEDFDPPASPEEELTTNLIPIRFPDTLFVADITVEDGKRRTDRQSVREWLSSHGTIAPSDYEIRGHQILTFRDLSCPSPFDRAIDAGTITPLEPAEYYEENTDQQNTFRSLLRLLLQQNLFHRDVRWNNESHVFFFCPRSPQQMERVERWRGQRSAERTVFRRKMNRNDPTKELSSVHLAFSVRFILLSQQWYAALVPDWFFSFGEGFARSQYSDEQLTRRKALEKEHSVRNAFRFIASWLSNRETGDLLAPTDRRFPRLEFGNEVCVSGGRPLDESAWKPLGSDGPELGPSLFED